MTHQLSQVCLIYRFILIWEMISEDPFETLVGGSCHDDSGLIVPSRWCSGGTLAYTYTHTCKHPSHPYTHTHTHRLTTSYHLPRCNRRERERLCQMIWLYLKRFFIIRITCTAKKETKPFTYFALYSFCVRMYNYAPVCACVRACVCKYVCLHSHVHMLCTGYNQWRELHCLVGTNLLWIYIYIYI